MNWTVTHWLRMGSLLVSLAGICAIRPGTALAQGSNPAATAGTDAAVAEAVLGEVLVLHATKSASPNIDPFVASLPQLKSPPLNGYNSFKVLSRQTYRFAAGAVATTALPAGRSLKTVLTAIVGPDRVRVNNSIGKEGAAVPPLRNVELVAKRGEMYFIAGQSYQGGVVVIGIRFAKP